MHRFAVPQGGKTIIPAITSLVRWINAVLFVCTVACATVSAARSQPAAACQDRVVETGAGDSAAHLIVFSREASLQVLEVQADEVRLSAGERGLLLWSDGQGEAWQYLGPGGSWRRRTAGSTREVAAASGGSRGSGAAEGTVSASLPTLQLDQLAGRSVFRGAGFVTPHPGPTLNPKITIRRTAQADGVYPASVALLSQGTRVIARIPFSAGEAMLSWEQIVERVPAGLRELSEGEYTLRVEGSAESTTFAIESKEWRDEVLSRLNELADLLGGSDNSLYAQAAVEHFLSQRDADGKPLLYLSDSLDAVDAVPDAKRSAHLRHMREELVDRLTGNDKQTAPGESAEGDTTGIPEIDAARRLIATGQWREALEAIAEERLAGDERRVALGRLYRATVLAESGLGAQEEADRLFRSAIEGLDGHGRVDRYLAHLNYAAYQLQQAQERLYNHPFQIATGEPAPLTAALRAWIGSAKSSQSALAALDADDQERASIVRVNTAKLYLFLADLIRTLDAGPNGAAQFAEGVAAAERIATSLAAEVATAERGDRYTQGIACELLAMVAYRQGEIRACREQARAAEQAYLDAGTLAGAESVYRTLGLCAQFGGTETEDANRQTEPDALRLFRISEWLAEHIRGQLPADRVGLTVAGYSARRAYVYERIIELLIDAGHPAEALAFAERSKARALRDVLLLGSLGRAKHGEVRPEPDGGAVPDLDAESATSLLAEWPTGVTALEYFVGTRKTWLFMVQGDGSVQAFDLLGDRSSRELVSEVRSLLDDVGFQARKMAQRVRSGREFDTSWQDRFYALRRTLIPDEVLMQLRQAETVVVVPHHILHYVPFSALVTEPDATPVKRLQMVTPRFLIDEQFSIVQAPSLAVWRALDRHRSAGISEVNGFGVSAFPSDSIAPLPGVTRDIEHLKAAFGASVHEIAWGAQAQAATVRGMLARPGLLLCATHGRNVPDQPLESDLLLWPEEGSEFGRLTAGDIFQTKVNADLVVMSACYSGLADRSPLPGDDLFGLQRALLQSGARCVVSGLWDVYDDTGPELMQRFFCNVASGKGAAASLAESQRTFLAKQRAGREPWVHPYFWAVFTCAGDGNVIMSPSQSAADRPR